MITIRRANDRGHADHGWLNTYHTFSFADYYDPRHMGFRNLRVINEDRVRPGVGFPTHPHSDMEIISYVLEGALAHRDSMGTGSVIRPGDVQRMSAGTGITHSEFNHSKEEPLHFYQIWILPKRAGITPSYEQKFFSDEEKRGSLRLIASPDGRDGSVTINQDARLYATLLDAGDEIVHRLPAGQHAWVQLARGKVLLNGHLLEAGDGAAVNSEELLRLTGKEASELLLFELP
ncbi:pirin family protein [Geomonas sp. Red69]|uniref:Pirin family protein n=1 Tax=Geomonas diazotrophica TaxID=2843197 RepID=A0ABX8JJJ9_9BACT|nr:MULTISPECIES: pirin family protein [Geomonas]MBU5636622.1 pirin family protein [Geomonas diazotrophica]QWV98558.1 pirin family protein [Geomonas nitrogeniifigens]QXE87741.1 pirin family protein [Geomonas nitrogeniifigens]